MTNSVQFCNDCRRALGNVLHHVGNQPVELMTYHRGDHPLADVVTRHLVTALQRGGRHQAEYLVRMARHKHGAAIVVVTLLTNDERLNTAYDQLLPEGVVKDVHGADDDVCQLVVNVQYTDAREAVATLCGVIDDLILNAR